MEEHVDPSSDKILSARTLRDAPAGDRIVPYANIGALLADQAERFEEKQFLIFYGEDGRRLQYTYGEFFDEARRTACYLQETGLRHGDHIAVASMNHPDVVIQYFAAFLLGALVVPLNMGEDDRRLSYILSNAPVRRVLVRDRYADRIMDLLADDFSGVTEVGTHAHPALPHFQSELSRYPARIKPLLHPTLDSDALIVYTSGTTGHPKGVLLDQYNLLADALAIAEWHQVANDQVMMCVLPLHHVNGTVVTLMTPLYAGAGVVLNEKFHPEKFLDRIAAEKVSIVSVVPTILQFLLHTQGTIDPFKLSTLRHVICGAGPLTVELAQKFERAYRKPIIHGYGLSETTCYSSFLPLDLTAREHRAWLTKFGFPSIGVPLPVNEMSIHDPDGNERDEGAKGEIVIRGHNVMKGYYRNPEANAVTFAHGWFRSGDEGFYRLDELGRKFFFITGRLKELIIRGGVNISPFEIDEVLMSIPGVVAGIAVGFENEWYGEEIGALVKVREGMHITQRDILSHCRKHLPFAKSPKVVVFTDDLPVTSTGKYQRNLCRHHFARWKAEQFREG